MAPGKTYNRFSFTIVLLLCLLIGVAAFGVSTPKTKSKSVSINKQNASKQNPESKKKNRVLPPISNYVFGTGENILYGRTEGFGLGGEKSSIFLTGTTSQSPFGFFFDNTDELEPSFSADGTKVVFVSRRDNFVSGAFAQDEDREIYIMNSDGSNQIRLTNNDLPEGQPRFSADGTKIVYIGTELVGGNPETGIYTMNIDGSNQTLIADESCYGSISAKNKRNHKNRRSFYEELNGFDSPNFSPDGSHIIFGLFSEAVYRVNSDGTGCQSIYFNDNSFVPTQAVYSPDGTKIAVVETDIQTDPETGDDIETNFIRILDPAGNQVQDIYPFNFLHTPAWSPDGQRLAYIGGTSSFGDVFYDGIWIQAVNTTENYQVNFFGFAGFFEGLTWGPPSATPNFSLKIDQPHPVIGGGSTQGRVKLHPSLVPPEGATISLSITGNSGVLSLTQTTVFVPSGLTEATFPIDTNSRTDNSSAEVRAEISGNVAEHTVTVLESKADLTITEFTAPAEVFPDTPFDVVYKIKNIGQLATDSTWQERVRFSDDPVFGLDPVIGSRTNPGPLDPDEEVEIILQVTIPGTVDIVNDDHHLLLQLNPTRTQSEGDYNNNSSLRPIHLNLPDLIAENLVVPASSQPIELYTITWDVRNQGGADAAAASKARLYFSSDNIAGNADDHLLDTVDTSALNAGQTQQYSSGIAIPTIPVSPTGASFFYVQVDYLDAVDEGTSASTGETNNNTFAATAFEYNVADLQIASVSPPPEIETDTVTPLAWNTNNAGNRATGTFFDQVFFSLDDQVGSDLFLGSFALSGGIGANVSVDRVQNISIPTNSVPANGNYYIYVKTDTTNAVNEGVNENNNITFQQVTIRKIDRPDLEVTNITAPGTAFFDQVVQLQWTVTNSGGGPTNTPSWRDRLFVGTNPNSLSGASFLGDSTSVSYLNVGESYVASATVRIPRGLNGSYHFLVATDYFSAVNEEDETNNFISVPVTLNVPLLPDYVVTQVQAPETAFAGAPIEISWEVKNEGDGSNQRNSQGKFPKTIDRVYLSQDTTLSFGTDRLIFSRTRSGELAADATYTGNTFNSDPNVQQFVKLPNDIQGEWYAFVLTDSSDQVYEFLNENNNSQYDQTQPGSPINILATPPDLVVAGQPTAPATGQGGQAIAISYTAKNQGAFATSATWFDAIYLSTDQTFDAGDTRLGITGAQNGLAAGAERAVDISVQLPNCIDGTYYLFAVTDHSNLQFEFDPNIDAEANNASLFKQISLTSNPPDLQVTNFQVPVITQPGQAVPISFTVTNSGGNTPSAGWTDRVTLVSNNGLPTQILGTFSKTGGLNAGDSYTVDANIGLPAFMEGEYFLQVTADHNDFLEECGGEDNNGADSAPFTVANNLPDLQIDSVTVPGTAQVGGTINVQWSGRNAGQAMNANPGWKDYIYLSTDPTYSLGDSAIGQELVQQVLTAGGTYQPQKQVTIPNIVAGTYYVLVFTDRINNVNEGTPASVFEQNNVTASIPITLTAPGVDLQVTNLTASAPTYAGRTVNVVWDVTNSGATDTLTSTWVDYVFLSRDGVIDNSDRVLGYQLHSSVLGAGQTYQETRNYLIPSGLTGDYKILVHTDRQNRVVENNDSNNISAPLSVDLQLPPPADLNITNITIPPTINLDSPAGISWTVLNSGPDSAIGTWKDSVYLSRDQFWDASDFLVGQKERANQSLSIGTTYTESIITSQLFVEEGDYYVIVRTDARNNVRETNEANNVSTSISQSTVEITELTVGTPFSTTLNNGRQKVFKFDPPSQETLIVSLMGEPGESNGLFTKSGSIVSRADYDFQGTRPGEPDQENVIAETEAETHYTLVSNDFVPLSFADAFDKTPQALSENGKSATKRLGTPDQDITVKAEVIPFSVRKVTPESGGNEGPLTIVAEGAKFQDGATMKLVAQDGAEIDQGQAKNSVNKVASIFDLDGKTPGIYDVVVTNPDNSSQTLTDGFEILQGGGHQLRSSIVGPSRLGITSQTARYTFSAINDGTNDATMVPVLIGVSSILDYQIDSANLVEFPVEAYPAGTEITSEAPLHIDEDGKRYLILVVPILRAGSEARINVDFTAPTGLHFTLEMATFPPLEDTLKDVDNPEVTSTLLTSEGLFNSNDRDTCFKQMARQLITGLLNYVLGLGPQSPCVNVALRAATNLASLLAGRGLNSLTGSSNSTNTVVAGGIAVYAGLALDIAECIGGRNPYFIALRVAILVARLLVQLKDCLDLEVKLSVSRPGSRDPNEKIEPEGYGPEKFIGLNQPLLYRINFENVAEATAPAQRISVVDQLPPTLDPRTVKIKEVGFKQYRFIAPENQAFFQQRVQLGADVNNLKADISAGLDILNGRIFWTITAVDPNTGERPIDPIEGILPPNNENHDGEGYVTFTIEPMAGLATRTELNNLATIIFDENEPIVTNTTSNLLDSDVPTSSVMALPATTDNPSIGLVWNGTEDVNGSGLQGFNVYASEDGGSYTLIFSNTFETSGTFDGEWGKNYRFYSIAVDNSGNVELPPAMPDASITVLGGDTEADLAPRPNGSDGTVDGTDTEQVRRFTAGLDTDFTYNEFQRADSAPLADGGNGGLTIADVVQSTRYANGLDPLAVAIGPNAAAPLAAKTIDGMSAGPQPRELRPVRVTRVDNQLTLAVELESQGDEVGAGFTITYDPAILSNPANAAAGTDAAGASLTLNTSQANTGKVGVLIDKDPTQPVAAGTRQIMTIVFDIAAGAPASTVVGFDNSPVTNEVADGNANPLTTLFSGAAISLLSPTAGMSNVAGRVLTDTGRQVSGAVVTITDPEGGIQTARTNSFGFYRFAEVLSGRTYVITVRAKGFLPETILRNIEEDETGLDITLQPEQNKKPEAPPPPRDKGSRLMSVGKN